MPGTTLVTLSCLQICETLAETDERLRLLAVRSRGCDPVNSYLHNGYYCLYHTNPPKTPLAPPRQPRERARDPMLPPYYREGVPRSA